jgi:hypothetical protein
MTFKGLGDQMRAEEQARKLELARMIAAGPPAGSGINPAGGAGLVILSKMCQRASCHFVNSAPS